MPPNAPSPAPAADYAPLPSQELPTAWLRAIRQAEESAPPKSPPQAPAVEVEPSDRPTIQPSGSNLSRYRVPNGASEPEAEPTAPVEPPPADLDLGGGI